MSGEARLPFRSEMMSYRMQGPAPSGLVSWCDGKAYDVIAPAFSVGVGRPLSPPRGRLVERDGSRRGGVWTKVECGSDERILE